MAKDFIAPLVHQNIAYSVTPELFYGLVFCNRQSNCLTAHCFHHATYSSPWHQFYWCLHTHCNAFTRGTRRVCNNRRQKTQRGTAPVVAEYALAAHSLVSTAIKPQNKAGVAQERAIVPRRSVLASRWKATFSKIFDICRYYKTHILFPSSKSHPPRSENSWRHPWNTVIKDCFTISTQWNTKDMTEAIEDSFTPTITPRIWAK